MTEIFVTCSRSRKAVPPPSFGPVRTRVSTVLQCGGHVRDRGHRVVDGNVRVFASAGAAWARRYVCMGYEMVFGYAMAVIAGFLPTAVGNWTGVPACAAEHRWTVGGLTAARGAFFSEHVGAHCSGTRRYGCFAPRVAARGGAAHCSSQAVEAIGHPAGPVLLLASNLAYYVGAVGVCPTSRGLGPYSWALSVLALCWQWRDVLCRCLSNGVDEDFEARNRAWLDMGAWFCS